MSERQSVKHEKSFTVDEANAMLPLVRSIVSDIQEVFQRVTMRRTDLHRLLRSKSRSSSREMYDDEMAESRADLQEEFEIVWKYREELESLGLVLRQPEEGVVEFPFELGGRSCFLCWEPGQEKIASWREADSHHSTRHPL
ncbi:MAG: DUF2203 domain-containing protein [Aureliella sp.]